MTAVEPRGQNLYSTFIASDDEAIKSKTGHAVFRGIDNVKSSPEMNRSIAGTPAATLRVLCIPLSCVPVALLLVRPHVRWLDLSLLVLPVLWAVCVYSYFILCRDRKGALLLACCAPIAFGPLLLRLALLITLVRMFLRD
jgi:hypothetical protein